MFKVGQVWRNNTYGTLYTVINVRWGALAIMRAITGRDVGWCGNLETSTAKKAFTLIGNNYKPKALTEQRGCRKEDC